MDARPNLRRGAESYATSTRISVSRSGMSTITSWPQGTSYTRLPAYAGDDGAAIGMADQHDVLEALPFDHVDDVGDVGREIDLGIDQVTALAEPGHRRREYLVAFLLEQVGDPPPAPPAMPGAVHQHEGFLDSLRSRIGRIDHAHEPRACRHAAQDGAARCFIGHCFLPHTICHDTCNNT